MKITRPTSVMFIFPVTVWLLGIFYIGETRSDDAVAEVAAGDRHSDELITSCVGNLDLILVLCAISLTTNACKF